MEILSAKKFNEQQDNEYKVYSDKCKSEGIEPTKQNRYFPKVGVNYGFVLMNRFGEIHWKKRKCDFAQ